MIIFILLKYNAIVYLQNIIQSDSILIAIQSTSTMEKQIKNIEHQNQQQRPTSVSNNNRFTNFQFKDVQDKYLSQNIVRKNPRVSLYAQKFKKMQNRPYSSVSTSVKKVAIPVPVRYNQPNNIGMMGSFLNNTKPNTRRISNSLAHYHAQLMKRNGSQNTNRLSSDINKMQIQRNYRNTNINRNDKNNQKLQYDTKYDDILFDMDKCTKKKLNKINSKTNQVRYSSSQYKTKQIQKYYFQQNNLNVRGLKTNPIKFPQKIFNSKDKNQNGFQSLKNMETKQKLATQQPASFQQLNNKTGSKYRFKIHKQQTEIKQIPSILSANLLTKSTKISFSPRKQQAISITKKSFQNNKCQYLIDYFGKIKENTPFDEIQRLKAMYYRDLIWKIWYNCNWKVKIQSYGSGATQSPRYFVGRGNNSKLVKAIMGRRWWWKLDTKQDKANFLWTQLKIYSAYQSQVQYKKLTNFQTQDSIAQNLQKQQKIQYQNPAQQYFINKNEARIIQRERIHLADEPMQFNNQKQLNKFNSLQIYKSQNNNQQPFMNFKNGHQATNFDQIIENQFTFQNQFQQRVQKDQNDQNVKLYNKQKSKHIKQMQIQQAQLYDEGWWNYKLTINDRNTFLMTYRKYLGWQNYIKNVNKIKKESKSSQGLENRKVLQKNMQILEKYPQKVTNHLQYSRLIGNKKALFKTMSTYYQISRKTSKFLPQTYHVLNGLEDKQYLKFLNEYYRRSKQKSESMWIVKPGQMSNRGCGIKVCADIQQIKKILKNRKTHNNGKMFTYIIQQYIKQPFLYQGRKFDIRHYIMINSCFGRIKGYFYQEGYIRTTSYKYTNKIQDSYIHLTNDAVQKHCKDYGKYEKGNKVSYEDFEKYLKSLPDAKQKGQSFYDKILPSIREITLDIFNASYYIIDPKRKGNNFQIFGIDVMIDAQFRPWLIEVNTNPCLELSSPVLAKIIPKMLDNAFAISLDPLFPPPNDISIGNKKNNLPDNYIAQNKFQLVFDEIVDGNKLNKMYDGIKEQLKQMEGYGSDQQAYQSAEDDYDAEY